MPEADRVALEKYLYSKLGYCGEAWSWASMTLTELQASVALVDPGIYVEPDGEPVTIEEEIELREKTRTEEKARRVLKEKNSPLMMPE